MLKQDNTASWEFTIKASTILENNSETYLRCNVCILIVTNPRRGEFYLLAFETEFKLCVVEVIYKSSTINIPSIFHSRMFISHVERVMKTVNNSIILSIQYTQCTVTGGMHNLQNALYPASFEI
jgi:hypothetical protein